MTYEERSALANKLDGSRAESLKTGSWNYRVFWAHMRVVDAREGRSTSLPGEQPGRRPNSLEEAIRAEDALEVEMVQALGALRKDASTSA